MSRLLFSLALGASTTACATLLDFQPAHDQAAPATATLDQDELDSGTTPELDQPVSPADAAAEAVPGWRGPFVVALGKGPLPACVGDYPIDAFNGVAGSTAPAASCACTCDGATNVACSAPSLSFFSDTACGTAPCHVEDAALACASVACTSGKPKSVSIGPSTASGGACAPRRTANVEPVSWAVGIRLCAAMTAIAVPPSSLFSKTNRCILEAGDNACPATYPVHSLYTTGGNDTRACAPCECGAPVGADCSDGAVTTSTDAQCTKDLSSPLPSSCVALAGTTRITTTPPVAEGGSCAASGGGGVGTFVENAPTTVCCLE